MLDIDKIKIGWKVHDIKYLENELMSRDDATEELYGVIDNDYSKIEVTKKYGNEIAESTLIHEIIHGISHMYSIGLIESDVTALANGIYTVLKDNKLKIVKE